MELRFGVLGPLTVHGKALAASRERTVLAVLLLEPNRVVPVERLIDAVWGEDPPATARAQIHTCISRLRRELGTAANAVMTDPAGYRIAVADDELDSLVFAARLAAARSIGSPTEARGLLRAALDLWRGPALAGIAAASVEAAARRLEEQRLGASEELIDVELRLGLERELVGDLADLVQRYPLRERLRGQLMVALYRLGRQAEALATYREARQLLADELGLDPGPELEQLHRQILTRDPSLLAHPVPDSPATAGPDGAKPAPPPSGSPEVPQCLPRDIGDFTGREAVVTELLRAIGTRGREGRPTTATGPVVAIDGMAGMGKTALALHVAHRVARRYPDAQLFVDLHGHSEQSPLDPTDALGTLLRQVGVAPSRVPESLDERAALWRTQLARRRALVVLDNVADTAQLAPLLPGGRLCLTLTTSRRRLIGLDGALPVSLDVLPPDEAVALLARVVGERVAAEPEAAAEVARLCGYLPLAIRLAAARLAHRPKWTVADLVGRLRAADPPLAELAADGRSVAAAFTLSYQHVSDAARRMFRLLGLHPGVDFDTHASAALADLPVTVAEDLLEDLVDAHLLEAPAAGRYRFHDLLRDYARQLVATEPDDVHGSARVRMLDFYLHTATAATAHLELAGPRRGLELGQPNHIRSLRSDVDAKAWLDTEWQNVVSTVYFADDAGMHRYTWLLSRALWAFLMAGYTDVLIAILHRALAAAEAVRDEAAMAMLHNYVAAGYWQLGRLDVSLGHLQEALALYRKVDDITGIVGALTNVATVHLHLGNYSHAMSQARDSLSHIDDKAVDLDRARVLSVLGCSFMRLGQLDSALRYHRRALAGSRVMAFRSFQGVCLGELGAVRNRMGRHQLAILLLKRARTIKRDASNRHGEAETLSELGCAYHALDQMDLASSHHYEALSIARAASSSRVEALVLNNLARTLHAVGQGSEALKLHQDALSVAERLQNRYEQARAHDGIATVCQPTDPALARDHWTHALALYTDMGTPERHEVAAHLASLNSGSGTATTP